MTLKAAGTSTSLYKHMIACGCGTFCVFVRMTTRAMRDKYTELSPQVIHIEQVMGTLLGKL